MKNTALPPAIIFDLDDTIIADSAMSDRCWEEVCGRFASRLAGASVETLFEAIRDIRRGNLSNRHQLERGAADLRSVRKNLLSSAFSTLGMEDETLVEEMTDSYMALKTVLVEPYPGALDTLRNLKREGTRLAMITNGLAEEQRAKVERAGLGTLFDTIVIEGEFGTGKPDERIFNHTLEQLQVTPGQAWMVGDNLTNDIGGAQAVGIYGVWVDWRDQGLPEDSPVQPDRTIRAIAELVNWCPALCDRIVG